MQCKERKGDLSSSYKCNRTTSKQPAVSNAFLSDVDSFVYALYAASTEEKKGEPVMTPSVGCIYLDLVDGPETAVTSSSDPTAASSAVMLDVSTWFLFLD
eukprot:3870921-Ditylum_brightwellii.AAC.2